MNKLQYLSSAAIIAALAFSPQAMAAGTESGAMGQTGEQRQYDQDRQVGQDQQLGQDQQIGQRGQAGQTGQQLSQDEVRELQQQLQQEGIDPGPIDGIWGPKTSSALEQYQQQQGVAATGQPNQQTLQSLGVETDQEFMGVSPGFGEDQQIGQRGQAGQAGQQLSQDEVRELQQQLQQEGIDPGPIDGIWGPKTSSALEQYQQQQGIAASGQPDQQTLQSLGVETDQEFMGVSPGFGEEQQQEQLNQQQQERQDQDRMRQEESILDREPSMERESGGSSSQDFGTSR